MEKLKLTIVQSKLHWEDINSNLKAFSLKLERSISDTDLIALPEMFTTGFSMNAAALAEPMNGRSMQWMAKQASKFNAIVTGSIIIEEKGKYFNRLIWMQPNGNYSLYDKRHLFTMAKEHETYEAGQKKIILEWKGWKICPLICYDLRFPIWSRNLEDYDLLLYLANWPVKRSLHWKILLQARAIENQAFTIGVNRVGKDGNDYYYIGDSCILSATGEWLFQTTDREVVHTQEISKNNLMAIRKKLPFLADRDSEKN